MVCLSCSTTIATGEASIGCEGFCSGSYHAKCVGLSSDEKISCLKNPHIFWICTTCSKMLRDIRYSANMQAQFKSLVTNSEDAPRTTQQAHSAESVPTCTSIGAIAEIKAELASIQKTLADLSTSHLAVLDTTIKEQPLAHSSPTTSNGLSQGSRPAHHAGVIPRQMGNTSYSSNGNKKFWLFFSRVRNDVTEDEIRSMVADCLGNTDSILVHKLVSNWIDASLLPYISFKVGIDIALRDRAMRHSTWPNGVWFREFKEKCYTWQPQIR